jgi:hypothetical protein
MAGTLAGVRMADEEPVLLADRGGPDGVFDEVVVEPGLMMLQVRGQRRPVPEQIGAGLAEPGPGQHLGLKGQCQPAQPVERPGKAGLPQGRALDANLGLGPLAFELIEPGDQPQHPLRRFRPLGRSLKKLPARVRPAPDPDDPGVRPREARIRLVAVGLQDAAAVLEQRGEFAMPARQAPVEDDVAAGLADDTAPTLLPRSLRSIA